MLPGRYIIMTNIMKFGYDIFLVAHSDAERNGDINNAPASMISY
jgi:hypothetical protein